MSNCHQQFAAEAHYFGIEVLEMLDRMITSGVHDFVLFHLNLRSFGMQ